MCWRFIMALDAQPQLTRPALGLTPSLIRRNGILITLDQPQMGNRTHRDEPRGRRLSPTNRVRSGGCPLTKALASSTVIASSPVNCAYT